MTANGDRYVYGTDVLDSHAALVRVQSVLDLRWRCHRPVRTGGEFSAALHPIRAARVESVWAADHLTAKRERPRRLDVV